DQSLGAFAARVTEQVIHELSGGGSTFSVVSPFGVQQFRGKSGDFSTIRERLHQDVLIAGEVWKEGERLLLRAHVIDTADVYRDSVLVQRTTTDPRSVEEVASIQLASELRRKLGQIVRLPLPSETKNTRAYELYLSGRRARADARAILTGTHVEGV